MTIYDAMNSGPVQPNGSMITHTMFSLHVHHHFMITSSQNYSSSAFNLQFLVFRFPIRRRTGVDRFATVI